MVDAGQALFLRHGLHNVTMEAIAREAGVAKATLYGYFADRDAVFSAVIERMARVLRGRSEAAFAGPGEGWQRIAEALVAKHLAVFELLDGSPHAAELYAHRPAGAATHLGELDQWFEAQLREIVDAGAHRDDDPVRRADIVIAAAEGVARRARRAEELAEGIRFLVRKLLG